jgi:hypothetical protein
VPRDLTGDDRELVPLVPLQNTQHGSSLVFQRWRQLQLKTRLGSPLQQKLGLWQSRNSFSKIKERHKDCVSHSATVMFPPQNYAYISWATAGVRGAQTGKFNPPPQFSGKH